MKSLGKITYARFGIGGYQECMIGLTLFFQGEFGGIGTDFMVWDPNMIKVSEHTKWTEESRGKQMEDIMRKVSDLLFKAKVDCVTKLIGVQVEVEIENQRFKSFRILTEVL